MTVIGRQPPDVAGPGPPPSPPAPGRRPAPLRPSLVVIPAGVVARPRRGAAASSPLSSGWSQSPQCSMTQPAVTHQRLLPSPSRAGAGYSAQPDAETIRVSEPARRWLPGLQPRRAGPGRPKAVSRASAVQPAATSRSLSSFGGGRHDRAREPRGPACRRATSKSITLACPARPSHGRRALRVG